MKACCTSCSCCSLTAMPSIVLIEQPSSCAIGTRQLFTIWPSINTVQAPHSPSPQPSLVPVSSSCWRSTSSKRSMGWASTVRCRSLIEKLIFVRGDKSSSLSLCRRVHHRFRHEGNSIKTDSGRIFDRVENRRRRTIHWQLTDAFRATRAESVRVFGKVDTDRRKISRGRHDVVGHLAVRHAPVLPDDVFIKRHADSLRHSTFNLPGGQHRINYFADFLHRDKVIDVRFVGQWIVRHLRNVHGPGKRAIRVTLVLLV